MHVDGAWRYSYNELYRLNVETAEIETRRVKNRGRWQALKDRERHEMPKVIRVAFEQTLEAVRGLRQRYGGSDSAHPSVGRCLQGASPLRL